MNKRNKVEVRIQGKDYTIVGEETEEYIQRVALYVDKKMNMVSKNAQNKLSTAMIAVLTAINVADEYLKNADEFKNLKEQMNANSNNLSEATVKIEEYKKENDELKTVIQNLKMSLVKKETELEEFTVRRRPNNSNNMVDFDAGKNKRNIK